MRPRRRLRHLRALVATLVVAVTWSVALTVAHGGTATADPGDLKRCADARNQYKAAHQQFDQAGARIDAVNADINKQKAALAKVRTPRGSTQAYQNYLIQRQIEADQAQRDDYRRQRSSAKQAMDNAQQGIEQYC